MSLQRYFTMLAIAIIIALVAMVFFTRNNKTVTGIKQVYKYMPPAAVESRRI